MVNFYGPSVNGYVNMVPLKLNDSTKNVCLSLLNYICSNNVLVISVVNVVVFFCTVISNFPLGNTSFSNYTVK